MKVIKYTFNGEQTLNYLYQNIDIPTDIYIYIYIILKFERFI